MAFLRRRRQALAMRRAMQLNATLGVAAQWASLKDGYPGRFANMREYFQGHWNAGTNVGYDCARMRRFGPEGDGGKVVCIDALPEAAAPCNVISVGVGGDPGKPPDFRFEMDLHARLPQCRIEVYDGTNFGRGTITNVPDGITFFPENFNPDTHTRYAGRHVDIFKIDCEGCEFRAVLPFVENVKPEQMMIEVHGRSDFGRPHDVHRLMKGLNQSYGIFYREPNIQHSDGTCIEFAMRRRGGRVLRRK